MLWLGSPLRLDSEKSLRGVSPELCEILYLGSLAPNSHNAQPWRVQLNEQESTLVIQLDNARLLSATDPERRESFITLGCYIQTLQEAFDAYGYITRVELHSDESATLNFEKREDACTDQEKVRTLKKRHTDKRGFCQEPVDWAFMQGFQGNTICYPRSTEDFQVIADATLAAVGSQSADMSYRKELAQWMRFSDDEVRETKDGITAEMLGLGRLKKALYYLTTNRESAEGDTFAQQGMDTAENQVRNCSAFLVITGGSSFQELVGVGRETVKVWLSCTELSISVQPMSAVLEIDDMRGRLEAELETELPIQMILRIGYTEDYGENMQVRRDLDEYIEVVN